MGWYGCERPRGTKDIDFFQKECGWEKEDSYCRILDAARNGSTVYLKVEVKHDNKVERYALVCLTRWSQDFFNFTYKPIEESMGPCDYHCPLRILDGLTEPANEYAAEWRKNVREWHKKKKAPPKFGNVIKFASPIRFTDGFEGDEFEVIRYGRRAKRYLSKQNGRRYCITNVTDREFEVV
jgi:hypothetical protein